MTRFTTSGSAKLFAFLGILLIAAIGTGIFAVTKGQFLGNPPSVGISAPGQNTPNAVSLVLGKSGLLELAVDSPSGVCAVKGAISQDGKTLDAVTYAESPTSFLPAYSRSKHYSSALAVNDLIVKGLHDGSASFDILASDCSRFHKQTKFSKPFSLDFTPPTVSITSTYHVINQGGAEVASYSVSPDTVWSGVRVGPYEFKGYPLPSELVPGAPVPGTPDASGSRFAFFVFSYDLPMTTAIEVIARDAAGNESKAALRPEDVKAQDFGKRDFPVSDDFITNKVMAIISHTPGLSDQHDPVKNFLLVNSELRKKNALFLKELTQKSEPTFFWKDAFRPLTNAAVEARFADYRTYLYNGQKIDEQVHLGYDLASFKNTAVYAAGAGKVIYTDYLGIYGNAIVIDHGYGLMSLYGHLNSMDVKVGDTVTQNQKIGNSGETGLAGGDHLHYSMLIQGVQTDSKEFWDEHWIEDHVYLRIPNAGFAHHPQGVVTP